MTSLRRGPDLNGGHVPTAAPDQDAPPLPKAWLRKVRAADVRLQRRMRILTAGAITVFVVWGGWVLLFS